MVKGVIADIATLAKCIWYTRTIPKQSRASIGWAREGWMIFHFFDCSFAFCFLLIDIHFFPFLIKYCHIMFVIIVPPRGSRSIIGVD